MKDQEKYFSIAFSLIILYLSFLLVKPFFGSLMSAFILSYIFHPFYEKINNKVKSKNLSIILILLIVVFVILIPLVLAAYSLIDDIVWLLNFIRKFDINSLTFISPEMIPFVKNYFLNATERFVSSLFGVLTNFLRELPDKLFNMLVFLFAFTTFLKEGPDFIKKLKITIPMDKTQKDALMKEFESVTRNIIYSVFLTAIFGGVVGAIIFYLFDIPYALLWAFMMALLSFIPMIGKGPVWVGGLLYLVLKGRYLMALLMGIITFMFEYLDNIIIVKIIGERSKINPFLILIGIISGMKVFGPMGLILGPLILSILITLIGFYTKNYREKFNF